MSNPNEVHPATTTNPGECKRCKRLKKALLAVLEIAPFEPIKTIVKEAINAKD